MESYNFNVAKPDEPQCRSIKQPDGSIFITDSVEVNFVCKCGLAQMYLHAGQISTPCPYCRRVWLAKHNPKTGQFKFIHYSAWWRTLWYALIGRR